jgi:hypothetical protein
MFASFLPKQRCGSAKLPILRDNSDKLDATPILLPESDRAYNTSTVLYIRVNSVDLLVILFNYAGSRYS